MSRFSALISDCDRNIREGRGSIAAKQLIQLNTARVPREFRLRLARLCRRVGLYKAGLNLLYKIVQSKSMACTDAEAAEYAVLLIRIGAVSEGLDRLSQLDTEKAPEALLYRAFGQFGGWNYQEAIEDLEKYLTAPLDDYARSVGRMNLAFAHAEIRSHEAAVKILDDMIQHADHARLKQLQSNCHGLLAQVHLQQRKLSEARRELAIAKQLVEATPSNDHRFLAKLQLILDGLETKSTKAFDELEMKAITNHDWEAIREAELYRLHVKYRRERFVHLYFGSPYQTFRELIAKEFGELPKQTQYVLGAKTSPRFDLQTGELDGAASNQSGKKCHQLVEVLLRDFYQPLRGVGMFGALYPQERFSLSSSQERVRQLIWRTRQWFEEDKIPILIVELDGFYSIRLDGPISIRIPLERPNLDPNRLQIERIKHAFAASEFRAREVQEKLGLPKSTVRKVLQFGIERGLISQTSADQTATYRILPQLKAA